ncbi:GBF-interacting protein 1-like [Pistacia vera]|uniref:GBF-interacting protein 1-like n=1 Tax=Pistacia vera TaxID=55513 RepID=UPI001263DD13|nr:GBF-interacting protein 1-like [Pistacia vera]
MSGKGGGGGVGKGNNGISAIPAGSRKMVQSLKEIVNCPETEIYAMLKDCNMDPNEAVNRLLAQDPFHEVKSKRDKRKEIKDTPDSRSRGAGNSNRGGRGGADRYSGRGGSAQFGSSEPGSLHGKPTYKKENGTYGYAGSSSSATGMVANSRRPPSHSESVASENKVSTVVSGDEISSTTQPSSGFQSAWLGVPGQISMADIVKMGRPQSKAPPLHNVNNRHVVAPPSAASHHDMHSSQDHATDINTDPGVAMSLHAPPNDEWPSIEQLPNVSSVLEAPAPSELYTNQSNMSLDRTDQQIKSQLDEDQEEEDDTDETPSANHVGSASVSSRNIPEDNSGGSSLFDNNLYNNMSSYQSHRHAFEHDEAEDSSSSVTAKLQQLDLQNDDRGPPPEEDNPLVIIPNHLQVHTPDCSHLSFGSFGSGSAFSGPFASRPLKSNLEEASEPADVSSIAHSDTRTPEYYGDEHLRSTSDANIVHRPNVSAGDYDPPSVSQPEVLKQETPEVAQENQYSFPSSAPGYTYENAQQLNTAFPHQQASSQMQNLVPFSSVMAYTNSLPSTLLASTVQTPREPDLQYSPFPVSQSMPTKYSNTASSISGPAISMPEALRASSISTPQPTPQTLPGASVATGPALPQHLAVHPYTQPSLPLGHFPNMITYPFVPQSYTYMPSAFQQTFAGNSTYHQSLAAAVLPQYKNSVSVSSLPQSAAVPSGYGFGSSTSIPGGNFPLNTPAAPAGTTIGYDDVLSSQYKDSNHLISLQQNDNSGMWVHGPGSRTMSAVPPSTYYSFQGQNQQPAGFRQGQQPSQHFGALGYPNFYHSQTGMSLEHQQQNPRDASLGGSQAQPSKQTQQLWQNNY